MHHSVLLLAQFGVVVDGAVKDKISRLHLLEWHIYRQCVILIRLVPPIQFESKVFSQIVNHLAH